MWPNPQETANSVTFTEEILNGKLQYLCSACWYIHLSLNIISTYLVLVLLFKDHWGFVHELLVCSLKIERYLFRDKSSCIFIYFVLSTLVFLINFVALPISMYIYVSSSLRKYIVSMMIVILTLAPQIIYKCKKYE